MVEAKPVLDPKQWRMKIHGNAVERSLDIGYEDLLKMPSRTVIATMECHGNGRTLFWEQQDEMRVAGGNWGLGASARPNGRSFRCRTSSAWSA